MPQMFPMNWLILFMVIFLMFMISIIKVYFYESPNYSSTPIQLSLVSEQDNKWMW